MGKQKTDQRAKANPGSINPRSLPSEETKLTPTKAGKILREGKVGGKPLTEKQKGFFGAVRGKKKEK